VWVDDVASILVTAALGTAGTDLFGARAPETPHNLVALIPYGGRTGEQTHSGTERRYPRLQVMTRNQQADLALAKAEAVRDALRSMPQQEINGTVYEAIIPLNEPMALAEDTLGRYPYVVNYEVRFHAP
jgi:hypothetical protein